MEKIHVGLQMISVKDLTPNDIIGVLKEVAEVGYEGVQDVPRIIEACKESGVKWIIVEHMEKEHYEVSVAAVALSLKDLHEILEAADAAGKSFYPTQTGRFTNANMTLKKWIADGLLGKVYFVDLDILRRWGIPTWGQFHIKEKNLAGAFADMCVHHVDALVEDLGNPALSAPGRA